jgi:hypothetical protein
MPVSRETKLRFFYLALVIDLNIETEMSKIRNYLLQAPGIISNETVHQIPPGSRISVAQVRNALITTGLWEEMKALAISPTDPRRRDSRRQKCRNVTRKARGATRSQSRSAATARRKPKNKSHKKEASTGKQAAGKECRQRRRRGPNT